MSDNALGYCPFKIGDHVRKHSGHRFVGIVVAIFTTLEGSVRLVVENTSKEALGLLFIFNAGQLEKAP